MKIEKPNLEKLSQADRVKVPVYGDIKIDLAKGTFFHPNFFRPSGSNATPDW